MDFDEHSQRNVVAGFSPRSALMDTVFRKRTRPKACDYITVLQLTSYRQKSKPGIWAAT